MGFRGNRGDTQGQPYENEHGRPLSMPFRRATGGYKETKFHWVGKGVGVAHSTAIAPAHYGFKGATKMEQPQPLTTINYT
jgi:hypothetical protein